MHSGCRWLTFEAKFDVNFLVNGDVLQGGLLLFRSKESADTIRRRSEQLAQVTWTYLDQRRL